MTLEPGDELQLAHALREPAEVQLVVFPVRRPIWYSPIAKSRASTARRK